jgi:hypothetical protein
MTSGIPMGRPRCSRSDRHRYDRTVNALARAPRHLAQLLRRKPALSSKALLDSARAA